MPYLQLITNVKVEDPKALISEFSKLSAETLGKPEVYISASYQYNEYLIFDGTYEPAFQCNVISAGNLDEMKNDEYTKKFFDYLTKKLDVVSTRGYVNYYDPGYAYIGYDGVTVANWLRDEKIKKHQQQN